ncbi:MAG TPA: hypothetical protein VIC62_12610 [Nakamurella sp.]
MSRLSVEVRGCVRAAAVIGERVDWPIACRAAALTGRDDTETVSAALDLGCWSADRAVFGSGTRSPGG